ncbi:MAG: hypothetical protein VX741_11100 [Pseudomonadota bacterium]|nr:hypothetical protein [Pseudomonadota bacterium]
MMNADEAGTLARVKNLFSDILRPKTTQLGGRIFKTTGDGALAEFFSAVDAVQCAVNIQRKLAASNLQIQLRIGISDRRRRRSVRQWGECRCPHGRPCRTGRICISENVFGMSEMRCQ